jgi:hypothetical protein
MLGAEQLAAFELLGNLGLLDEALGEGTKRARHDRTVSAHVCRRWVTCSAIVYR